jgi:3-oxoacyl-[acyl-carrier-protein] synthase III
MSLRSQVIRVTNLPGADLNAACSGLTEARPMDGLSNEHSEHRCNVKDEGYTQSHWRCSQAASERIPMSLRSQVIRVTNLPGADLNAACSGLTEARPMDGLSNEHNEHRCNVKDEGY